jgi:hypothetical protein
MSRCIFVLMVGLLLIQSAAVATVYVIRPDGTGDFPTIQAAVDAAMDGDVIELTDGTFTGPDNRGIAFGGKSLTVRSQSGDPHGCIIDGAGVARGFRGHLNGSVEGISVIHGHGDAYGGAIYINAGALTVRRCVFSDNHAPANGGAAFIDLCSRITFEECVFAGNSSSAGGGICT